MSAEYPSPTTKFIDKKNTYVYRQENDTKNMPFLRYSQPSRTYNSPRAALTVRSTCIIRITFMCACAENVLF